MALETTALLPRFLRRIGITLLYVTLGALILYSPKFAFFQQDRVLNVCMFTETLSYEAIEKFQQETGIKVNLTYVEIDAQTYAKFCINQCRDYDVMNLSDTYVYKLSKQGWLQEIDWSKVPNINRVYDVLKHRVYDPENCYVVPHKWYIYGIVYDRVFFNNMPPEQMSWEYILKDPKILHQQGLVSSPYRTCMVDDARDAALVTAMYLFNDIAHLDTAQMERVQQVMLAQKPWVEAYTLYSAQYFLFTKIVPIAAMTSNYMRRIYANSDRFEFAIPKEGSVLIIENMIIPKHSKNHDLAHQFINFMLRDDIARLNSKTFTYNSANQYANDYSDPRVLSNPHMFPDAKTFERLRVPFLSPEVPKLIEKCWLSVALA